MTIKEFKELVKDLDEECEIWFEALFPEGSCHFKPKGVTYYDTVELKNKIWITNKPREQVNVS